MTPTVWSERRLGSWVHCTQCANLMVLDYAGFTGWPLGYHTQDEFEAFDEADDRFPNDTGATFDDTDLAIRRRYGVEMHRIGDGSMQGLGTELSRAGRAYAIAGWTGWLPAHLRRWDPAALVAHAICYIPDGQGGGLWLDPLAPMGYAGDKVAIQQVIDFAFDPSDARWLAENELVTAGEEIMRIVSKRGARVQLKAGARPRIGSPAGALTSPFVESQNRWVNDAITVQLPDASYRGVYYSAGHDDDLYYTTEEVVPGSGMWMDEWLASQAKPTGPSITPEDLATAARNAAIDVKTGAVEGAALRAQKYGG